jgi:prepilin-type N-terminal cleavage/methylation domain-containing protein
MDARVTMQTHIRSESGMSLIETMVAMLVLTIGAMGMASVFLYGMQSAASSPNELTATQKAAESIENVFSARDSKTITWAQLRNVAAGGVFISGQRNVTLPGADGIVNTADDGAVESVTFPGPDQTLGTGDDTTQTLTNWKRQITITDEPGDNLRKVTVTITYPAGSVTRTYSLTVFISSFA